MSACGKGLEQFTPRAPTNASHQAAIAKNAINTHALGDTSQIVGSGPRKTRQYYVAIPYSLRLANMVISANDSLRHE